MRADVDCSKTGCCLPQGEDLIALPPQKGGLESVAAPEGADLPEVDSFLGCVIELISVVRALVIILAFLVPFLGRDLVPYSLNSLRFPVLPRSSYSSYLGIVNSSFTV